MSGEFDRAKGRAEQAVGDLTDDDEMQREGEVDEAAGKLKEKVGQAKEKIDDVIDEVRSS